MSIVKTIFGKYNGSEVYSYTLNNGCGLEAEILSLGGIVRRLVYNGVDVVFGRDTFEEYLNNSGYFGALIGRNSNRIKNSEFCLNGKFYKISPNNRKNNLHGGHVGFDKKLWASTPFDGEEPSVALWLISPDGEEGFPGNVNVTVTYTLTRDNALKINYRGESDQDTVLNMTNHSYFNLNGHSSGTVDNHSLWIDSNFYTPNGDDCVPTGEVLSVADTPFDFTIEKVLKSGFESDHPQLKKFGGYDHNFALNGSVYRKVASVKGNLTNIVMEVHTDKAGMQLYTCNSTDVNRICKNGAVYPKHGALCLETQDFPNNLNFSHFPGGFLRKGEVYNTTTSYKFI